MKTSFPLSLAISMSCSWAALSSAPCQADERSDLNHSIEQTLALRHQIDDELTRAHEQMGAAYRAVDGRLRRAEDQYATIRIQLEDEDDRLSFDTGPTMEKLDAVAHRYHVKKGNMLLCVAGDSVACGEAVPDRPGSYEWRRNPLANPLLNPGAPPWIIKVLRPAQWTDASRHYSARNAYALVADSIRRANPNLRVDFISKAQSGAKLQDVKRQLASIADEAHGRKIDALFIVAGADDIDWPMLVRRLIHHGVPGSGLKCWEIEKDFLEGKSGYSGLPLNQFPQAFVALRQTIADLKLNVAPQKIYLQEYPDFTSDDHDGASMIDLLDDYYDNDRESVNGSINHDDLEWARERLLDPLNCKLRECAASCGWRFIGGISRSFVRHGYAAAADHRWIVTATESRTIQGDQNGTMHPNAAGQLAVGLSVVHEFGLDLDLWDQR
jgi:hypothetical protein